MDPWGQACLFCMMSTVAGTCDLSGGHGISIVSMAEESRQPAGYVVGRETATRSRSSVERVGARRRERLMTRSCCFMSRLSATTALAPPVPMSFAMVVNRWMSSISRSFTAEQGREGRFQEQVCLSCRFQVIITNSPRTATRYVETFILILQAFNLSVIFSVVAFFLLSWHWPASILSLFLCALFLYAFRKPMQRLSRSRHR